MKRIFNHEPYKYDADTLKQVHRGVIGAIIGDIVGWRLEFKRNKEYNLELFTDANDVADDTVMTIANADWLQTGDSLLGIMQDYGNRYPTAGYGGMFYNWLKSRDPKPY